MLHDFDVYQGKSDPRDKNKLGLGASTVLKMCETPQKHANYNIFADNFFTSLELIEKLSEDGFFYVGTVRGNHLGKSL